jgi:hypothetical protein
VGHFRFARVLATVLISVFMLCYGSGLLFRGPLCIIMATAQIGIAAIVFLVAIHTEPMKSATFITTVIL